MKIRKLSKKTALVLLTVVALGVVAVGAYFWLQPRHTETFYPKAQEGQTPKPTPTPTNTSALDAERSQQSKTPIPLPQSSQPTCSASGAICISSPTQGATVSSGTLVSGNARVFEGRLNFRLKGSNSGVLASGAVQVTGDSTQVSPYSFTLGFTNNVCDRNKNCGPGAADTGVLEVFSYSAKDGSEINNASIAVNIKG